MKIIKQLFCEHYFTVVFKPQVDPLNIYEDWICNNCGYTMTVARTRNFNK